MVPHKDGNVSSSKSSSVKIIFNFKQQAKYLMAFMKFSCDIHICYKIFNKLIKKKNLKENDNYTSKHNIIFTWHSKGFRVPVDVN